MICGRLRFCRHEFNNTVDQVDKETCFLQRPFRERREDDERSRTI